MASLAELVEVARGALLATHAASGLAAGLRAREVVRLFRSAEGLLRAGVALIEVEKKKVAAKLPTGLAPPASTPSASKRRASRRRRQATASDKPDRAAADNVGGGGASMELVGRHGTEATSLAGAGLVDVDHYMEGSELGDLQLAICESPVLGGGAAVASADVDRGSATSAVSTPSCVKGEHKAPVDFSDSAEARSVLEALETWQLRSLARTLGGSGQGSRSGLITFCVRRRFGGPEEPSRGAG